MRESGDGARQNGTPRKPWLVEQKEWLAGLPTFDKDEARKRTVDERNCFNKRTRSSGLAQVAGGLAMLSGVLIRLGAISIIIVMLGAIFLVHLEHGFDIGKGGLEYALTQLLVATALLITAAGRYSLAGVLPAWLRKR